MLPKFQQFTRERKYLSNVTPATIAWYEHAFKWLRTESPSQDELKDVVMRMRERGLKPTGCNCVIRAINAYLKWSGSPFKIPKLKEPQLILPTFTAPQVALLVSRKPTGFYARRLHLVTLILLDTGARINEALGLRVAGIDFDNLLMTLDGKGQKQRKVPFSFELRKVLYRYITDYQRKPHALLLATGNETKLGRRVVLRDVKLLCQELGFDAPKRTLHAFRHTFAIHYLRKGGSVFHLQKVLGHSSLEMTRRYANLLTEDLQEIHQRISLLAA